MLLVVAVGCGGNDTDGSDDRRDAAKLAARGEAAFFDTLSGTADRQVESINLLEEAVEKNPADGRSYFLLGMMHMFRFSRDGWVPQNASDFARREIAAAQAALDAAVPLLPADRRIPGFRGAATFMNGVVTPDAERMTLGLAQLRDAVALYPEFNNFSFVGAVAGVVPPTDPLFAEALGYIGDPLASSCNPFSQPEICGNAGKAPHNVEGALVLFGDLFAKAGNLRNARFYYQLSLSFADAASWRFRSVAEQRLASAAERIALYLDGDPSNDPPLVGYRDEACAVCHYR
jgi:hypothetical protein